MSLEDDLRASGSRYAEAAPEATVDGLSEVIGRSAVARRRRTALGSVVATVAVVALVVVGLGREQAERALDLSSDGGGRVGRPPGTEPAEAPTSTLPDPDDAAATDELCSVPRLSATLAALDRATAIDRFACRDGWAVTVAVLGDGSREISLFRERFGGWMLVDGDLSEPIGDAPPMAELFAAMGIPLPTTPAAGGGDLASPPSTVGPTGDDAPPPDDANPAPLVTIVDHDPALDPPPAALAVAAGATIDAIAPENRPTEVGDRIAVRDAYFLDRTTARPFTDDERDAIRRELEARGLTVSFVDPTRPVDDPASGLVIGDTTGGEGIWSDGPATPPPGGFAVRTELTYPDLDGNHLFGGQGATVTLTPVGSGWSANLVVTWIT